MKPRANKLTAKVKKDYAKVKKDYAKVLKAGDNRTLFSDAEIKCKKINRGGIGGLRRGIRGLLSLACFNLSWNWPLAITLKRITVKGRTGPEEVVKFGVLSIMGLQILRALHVQVLLPRAVSPIPRSAP